MDILEDQRRKDQRSRGTEQQIPRAETGSGQTERGQKKRE